MFTLFARSGPGGKETDQPKHEKNRSPYQIDIQV
jgi:hypothetical protein